MERSPSRAVGDADQSVEILHGFEVAARWIGLERVAATPSLTLSEAPTVAERERGPTVFKRRETLVSIPHSRAGHGGREDGRYDGHQDHHAMLVMIDTRMGT